MKMINSLKVGLIAISMVASGSLLAAAPGLATEVAVGKLELPWDMAFLRDGTMFFTEKCKGLSVRLPSGAVNKLHGLGGTTGYSSASADLFCDGQAGMMGVAVDPDFDKNRHIYVFSSSKCVFHACRYVVSRDAGTSVSRDVGTFWGSIERLG